MSMRVTDNKLQNHVTLLYWKKEDKEHYAWVKSLNRLLSRLNKHNGQTYFCERCFQGFVRPGLLQKHEEMCRHFPAQATKMVDKEIKFTSWAKTEPTLFQVYGDFECAHKEEDSEEHGKTKKAQKYIPCSFAWVLVLDHPDVESRTKLYRHTPAPDMSMEEVGEHVVDELIVSLQELEEELKPILDEIKPMELSEERRRIFKWPHIAICVTNPSQQHPMKRHQLMGLQKRQKRNWRCENAVIITMPLESTEGLPMLDVT